MIHRTLPTAMWVCLSVVATLAGTALHSSARNDVESTGASAAHSTHDLHDLAEAYRVRYRMPALGVGVVDRGAVVGLGMAGERTEGSGALATIEDAFDVSAVAESVTATMAALLVEQGLVRWDTTLAEALPDLKADIHPAYANVTLELLLQHRAGLEFTMNRQDRWRRWHDAAAGGSAADQRYAFAAHMLRRPPAFMPGTMAHVASDGYVIAGTILERAAGVPWETLVRTRLFEPLGLASMRYGASAPEGRATAVVGHELGWFGRSLARPPDPAEYGSPPFGSPAGFLYASIPDLLRWVNFHIQGANGQGTLLPAAAFRRLHTPPDGQAFALGWETDMRSATVGRHIEHSLRRLGGSGRFRVGVWFIPEVQWGAAVVVNSGRGPDDRAIDAVLAALRTDRPGAP